MPDVDNPNNLEVWVVAVWSLGWMSADSKVHLIDILPSLIALWANPIETVMELESLRFKAWFYRSLDEGRQMG